jgi:hypothetical protein
MKLAMDLGSETSELVRLWTEDLHNASVSTGNRLRVEPPPNLRLGSVVAKRSRSRSVFRCIRPPLEISVTLLPCNLPVPEVSVNSSLRMLSREGPSRDTRVVSFTIHFWEKKMESTSRKPRFPLPKLAKSGMHTHVRGSSRFPVVFFCVSCTDSSMHYMKPG